VLFSGCRGSTRARPSPRSSRACTRAPLPERCSVSTHQLDHMTWQDRQQRGLSMAGTAQCAVLTQLYNTGRAAEVLAAMQCATRGVTAAVFMHCLACCLCAQVISLQHCLGCNVEGSGNHACEHTARGSLTSRAETSVVCGAQSLSTALEASLKRYNRQCTPQFGSQTAVRQLARALPGQNGRSDSCSKGPYQASRPLGCSAPCQSSAAPLP
jgi:hypothetical protein